MSDLRHLEEAQTSAEGCSSLLIKQAPLRGLSDGQQQLQVTWAKYDFLWGGAWSCAGQRLLPSGPRSVI